MKTITIYGDGVADAELLLRGRSDQGIERMMNGADDFVAGPVNLGNPGEFTIKQLAEMTSG